MTTQARELAGIISNAGDLLFDDDVTLQSDGAILNFGADSEVTVTHVHNTGLLVNSTKQLQFGDSGTYIYQSADGVLNLTSDTEVEINATTVDINANVDVSGNIVLGGTITVGDADTDNMIINANVNSHIIPNTDDTYDLGSSGQSWRNLYINGTAEADAYTVNGTALNEYIADTVGAMVGSNTESGIAVAYQDGDNTLDFTVATLNQDTTGTAAIATTVTTADESSDTTCFPLFVTAATGDLAPKSGSNLAFNSSSGALTATSFVGALTGDVTGNTSGTAATVTTAAQSNITSLGTLTTLTVDNVIINGSTIGHTGDTDLITVASGIATVAGEVSMTTLDIGGTNVTSTAAELNILDGVTSTAAELNILDGVTSTAAEINALDGITAVVGELNALDIGATAVGTAVASKAVILDSNKDYTGIRNLTITGELDAATLDISGDADIDGTLETDNLTVGGAQGSDGQVLTSTGSGVAWENAASGGASAIDGLSDAVSGITNFTNSLILGHQTTGTLSSADGNTAVGYAAMDAITSGDNNVAVGFTSLSANTTGSDNVAVGKDSLAANTTATYNTGVGSRTLATTNTGVRNAAVGYAALEANTTGGYNVAVGMNALYTNTTASNNTALGYSALGTNSTGAGNTAVGVTALHANTTAANNTAVGYLALTANTTGANNVAFGSLALDANTTASNNTAFGYSALSANTTGSENVAVGENAGVANTTGHSLVCVGANAGTASTTAVSVTYVGRDAGAGLTGAGNNVFVGTNAGSDATSNSTSCCVFVGANAGDGPILGYHNIAIGMNAFGNTASGKGTNAYGNSFVGHYAGYNITSGDNNTSMGKEAGMEITTGSNNLLLGYQAGKSTSPAGSVTTASNILCLGDDNIATFYCAQSSINTSDARDKADVTNFTGGLSWVNAMRPVTYKWDKRSWYVDKEEWDETGENITTPAGTSADILAAVPDGTHKKDPLNIGLLAQEVLDIEKANGFGSNNDTSLVVDLTQDETTYGLDYSRIIPILVSAIKELSAKVEVLENN